MNFTIVRASSPPQCLEALSPRIEVPSGRGATGSQEGETGRGIPTPGAGIASS